MGVDSDGRERSHAPWSLLSAPWVGPAPRVDARAGADGDRRQPKEQRRGPGRPL